MGNYEKRDPSPANLSKAFHAFGKAITEDGPVVRAMQRIMFDARLLDEAERPCDHEWVIGDNAHVSNASVCLKCSMIAPTNAKPPAPQPEATQEGVVSPFELWFFRDLLDEHRLQLLFREAVNHARMRADSIEQYGRFDALLALIDSQPE